MNWFERRAQRREDEWWARYRREHRWDKLATYNAEISRGIVHTEAYDAAMKLEQLLFDAEHVTVKSGFPIRIDP